MHLSQEELGLWGDRVVGLGLGKLSEVGQVPQSLPSGSTKSYWFRVRHLIGGAAWSVVVARVPLEGPCFKVAIRRVIGDAVLSVVDRGDVGESQLGGRLGALVDRREGVLAASAGLPSGKW